MDSSTVQASTMTTTSTTTPGRDEARVRRVRRAELLLQRQRAADRRRKRGFGLRLPSSKPLVFPDLPGRQRPV
jgi:hypothetical protein